MSGPAEDRRTPLSLWLLSALLLGFDAWLVSSLPLDVPYLRELYFVGVATGREVISWEFLHRPTLEHVMPLPMALGAFAVRTTGIAGINRVLNLVVLALTAWVVLRAAATIRGRARATDALVLLVALGPAHVFSFVSGFNLQLVLSAALFVTAIAAAAVCATDFRRRWLSGGLAALLGLPLCGVSGVLSLGFAWPALAWVAWRSRGQLPGAARGVASALFLVSAALGLQYFPWSRLSEDHPHVVSPLRLAAELVPAAFGAAGSHTWPWSFGVVAAFVIAPLVILGKSRARATLAVIGLGMAGQIVIALAIGYGRSHYDNALAFTERYVELAAPWLLFAHLGLVAAERDGNRAAPLMSHALGGVALLTVVLNGHFALGRVREAEAGLRAFAADARAGLTLAALADRHGTFLYPFDRGVLLAGLSTLMLERRPPFDETETRGLLSLESHESPCASERVSWVKVSAPGTPPSFAFAPERALDGHGPSEWHASDTQAGVLELELAEARPLSLVCLLPGKKRSGDPIVRVEAWEKGRLVTHAVGRLESAEELSVLPLSAPSVDRLRVHVSPGESLAELGLAP